MRRRDMLECLVGSAVLLHTAVVRAAPPTPEVKASLAPTGSIRIAINYGNAALAMRDPATDKLSGVSVDIAEELGRRVGLPIVLVPFDAAGKVSAAAAQNIWDVAFLARDPERARDISFTAAYVIIEGNYVVRKDSPIATLEQVDQDGIRVAVSTRSAYDLFLSRSLKHAQLLHAGSTPETIALFKSQRLEVLAGVKQALRQAVAADPTLRIIPEPFMQINQAMGTPAGRPLATAYLQAFVEDIKSNGDVAKILARNGQVDSVVAPPA